MQYDSVPRPGRRMIRIGTQRIREESCQAYIMRTADDFMFRNKVLAEIRTKYRKIRDQR